MRPQSDLLCGAHGLRYEYACLRLRQALADLDNALVTVPDTVSRAIRSELELEETELCAALDDFSGRPLGPEPEIARHWEFDHPFVKFGDGSATGSPVIGWPLPTAADAGEITNLLELVDEQPLLLAQ